MNCQMAEWLTSKPESPSVSVTVAEVKPWAGVTLVRWKLEGKLWKGGKKQKKTKARTCWSSAAWTLPDRSGCILWLLCAEGPLAKRYKQCTQQKVLANLSNPSTSSKQLPPVSIWSEPLQSRTLWGQDRKQLVVLPPPSFFYFLWIYYYYFFVCSCCVSSLSESCVPLLLISVFPHCCQWFVDHSPAWHHQITSRRHDSTRHPHLIASIVIHVHFILGLSLHCGHVTFKRVMYVWIFPCY